MELDLLPIIRGLATVGFLGGLIWAGWTLVKPFDSSARPFRLGRVLRRLGIDIRSLREEPIGTHRPIAARICLACPDKAACDAWLANENPEFEPPAFCPNMGYLRVVASESRRK